ncbi:MAG: hypothetical protein JJ900_06410 [Rhodospirillales bacterium]|nr:hypothetical protein [Rhodospirillales bacterium]MBO6786468.1 hypothetical protein [Rhodospirillales bacterium]
MNRPRTHIIVAAAILLAALIFTFDLYVPLGVAAGMPYIALVLLGVFLPANRDVVVLALAGSILTVGGYLLSEPGGIPWVVLLNRVMALAGIWMTATLICYIKNSQRALVKARDEANQANLAKSQFLASISHELRTPLNAILGFSDILVEQYFGPPGKGKYREYAKDIHSSGEYLLELVNDLLNVASIESGKISLHKEHVLIGSIIDECIHTVETRAKTKDIDVVSMLPEGLPAIYADKRAIRQILLNLLSNSVKFTPNGGKIVIDGEVNGMAAKFSVADNGAGIPPGRLADILNPTKGAGDDPYVTEEGWGLGLAISRSLAELHGGVMNIASELGQGTTVIIEIPRQVNRPTSQGGEASPA